MEIRRQMRALYSALREFSRSSLGPGTLSAPNHAPRIGLALGGGFARGIAHAGVLEVFRRHGIPIHCITGVSAGAIVAAAFASGASPEEIGRAGCAMRFGDIASWRLGRMGFAASERMNRFLERLLKHRRFEEMPVRLGVVATDLATGSPVPFRDSGDVFLPVRASCSYPGLFRPVSWENRLLVDGAIGVEIPALLARQLGASRVVAVQLPSQVDGAVPENMFQVVNRCFQILQARMENEWRRHSDLVIVPDVRGVGWDGFESGPALIRAGEAAAEAVLPVIRGWLPSPSGPAPALAPAASPLQ